MRDAPLDYEGRTAILHFLQTLGDDESEARETVTPPTRLSALYRAGSNVAKATRVSARDLLAAQGAEQGVVAGHFTLEVEQPASGQQNHHVTIVSARQPIATLIFDNDGYLSAFERGREATPEQLAEAFECLSDIAGFRAAAKRLDIPPMTDEARAELLSNTIAASYGLRWSAQLPHEQLIDLQQMIGPARRGGPPVSLQQIPRELRREPLSHLFFQVVRTLSEEQPAIMDALFEEARKLPPKDRLELLRTFSDRLPSVLDKNHQQYGSGWEYGLQTAMNELRRIAPLVAREEADLTAVVANLARALPSWGDSRIAGELAQRAAQFSPTHRGEPIAALLARADRVGELSVATYDAFWASVRELPSAALNDALPTVGRALRNIEDAAAIPRYWDELHELNATLREEASETWMAVTRELGLAIDPLPVGHRAAAFARLQDDVVAGHGTRGRWGGRSHVAEGLSGMVAALPALEAESGAASADEAARWLLGQAQQLLDAQSMSAELRAALLSQREPFDILVRAASATADDEQRAEAVRLLCLGANEVAIRQPERGALRWCRLAQVIGAELRPEHRDEPYRILSNVYLSSSVSPALQEIVMAGPENIDRGKWLIDLGTNDHEVGVRLRT